jgi:hypothetical protein
MTTASIATVVVITVKDSVGAIFRPTVNTVATIDGNRLNAYSYAVKQRNKKPPTSQPAAFYFVIYRALAVSADDCLFNHSQTMRLGGRILNKSILL